MLISGDDGASNGSLPASSQATRDHGPDGARAIPGEADGDGLGGTDGAVLGRAEGWLGDGQGLGVAVAPGLADGAAAVGAEHAAMARARMAMAADDLKRRRSSVRIGYIGRSSSVLVDASEAGRQTAGETGRHPAA
jgi:hypothetical protein